MSSDTDRDSIYLDTLSMQSGSTNYNNRKSIALSQQTIYHSTEDLPSATNFKEYNNEDFIESQQKYHSDVGLNEYAVDGGELPLHARLNRGQNTQDKDEVSAFLLDKNYSNTNSLPTYHQRKNKQKTKQIVTYNEWKSRVKPALLYHVFNFINLLLYLPNIFVRFYCFLSLTVTFNFHNF